MDVDKSCKTLALASATLAIRTGSLSAQSVMERVFSEL